jgi:hypothetical protein
MKKNQKAEALAIDGSVAAPIQSQAVTRTYVPGEGWRDDLLATYGDPAAINPRTSPGLSKVSKATGSPAPSAPATGLSGPTASGKNGYPDWPVEDAGPSKAVSVKIR